MTLLILLLAPLLLLLVALGAAYLFTVRVARQVEQALPPAGRFVDVPGARLHVVEAGPPDAPVLLLVHGLAGQLCHFRCGVMERLATQYRVVAVDRPGSGYSQRLGGAPADLATQSDAMAALISTLHLGCPLVVGHSLGGALALTLAVRHPQKVAALVLVAPLVTLPEGSPAAFRGLEMRAAWLRRLVAWTLAAPLSIRRRDAILGLVFGPEPVPAEFATRGGGLLALRPSHVIAASEDLVALPDALPALTARFGEIGVPISMLYGLGDRILDPAVQPAALLACQPAMVLTQVNGGHMLPVTQPALTASFIAEAAARAGLAGRAELGPG